MQFGFTLKPEHTIERTLALTRQAEAAGFDYGWLFDSHVLWREPYVLLTLMAQATTTLRLGTCVTNPATREPSVTASSLAVLDEISGGRMDLGIGRGDSARRVLGKPPTTMATLEEAVVAIKALVEGRSIDYEGTELRLPWTGSWTLPVWVAGYGPMALAMTGRVADGIILQLADPDLIRWFVAQVREAASAAGGNPPRSRSRPRRRPTSGSREEGRERTRWFPALVSNHVVDLVNKYPREQLPESLTGYVTRPDRLRLPPSRRGRLVQRGLRRRRGDGPVLRPRLGRGPHREAARARRCRRGPVQHVPDERRRGGPGGGVRSRRHPGAAGVAIASGVAAETGTLPSGHPFARLEHGARDVLIIPGLTFTAAPPSRRDLDQDLPGWPEATAENGLDVWRIGRHGDLPGARRSRTSPTIRRGRAVDVRRTIGVYGGGTGGRMPCGWRSGIRTTSQTCARVHRPQAPSRHRAGPAAVRSCRPGPWRSATAQSVPSTPAHQRIGSAAFWMLGPALVGRPRIPWPAARVAAEAGHDAMAGSRLSSARRSSSPAVAMARIRRGRPRPARGVAPAEHIQYAKAGHFGPGATSPATRDPARDTDRRRGEGHGPEVPLALARRPGDDRRTIVR